VLQLIDKYGNVYGEGPIIVTTKDGKLKTNVTTSTAWGSITGILSNQTDLQSALNAKQATLVSGTNIKTINGSSILGSGNLIVSSGVSSVIGTAPISSSGGSTPNISITKATSIVDGYLSFTDWNTFNGKQDALVSGTNIKTINGSSILGSGNLVITDGVSSVSGVAPIASSGGATPSISIATANTSTTGAITSIDWNRFNAKQNALTLTTTGTSGPATLIADTLNIPQYSGGGGGASGIHVIVKPQSGTSVSATLTAGAFNTIFTTTNRLTAQAFIPANTFTCSNLYINVATLGAGVNARILIYSNNNGLPNTKLYESANLDCSTTGNKTATTSFTFNAGTTYWLCTHCSGSASLTSFPPANVATLLVSGTSNVASYIYNYTFGSAPTTLSGQGNSVTAIPAVFITSA
jgi:hypothetical protein